MILSQVTRQVVLISTVLLAGGYAQASALFTGSVFGEFDSPNAGYWDYTRIYNNDQGNTSSAASVFNWGKTSRYWGNGCRSWYGCANHSNFSFDGVGVNAGTNPQIIAAT